MPDSQVGRTCMLHHNNFCKYNVTYNWLTTAPVTAFLLCSYCKRRMQLVTTGNIRLIESFTTKFGLNGQVKLAAITAIYKIFWVNCSYFGKIWKLIRQNASQLSLTCSSLSNISLTCDLADETRKIKQEAIYRSFTQRPAKKRENFKTKTRLKNNSAKFFIMFNE
jgi:hypothetical protein